MCQIPRLLYSAMSRDWMGGGYCMQRTRPPAVAGLFYPGQDAALRATVRELIDGFAPEESASSAKLLIVPHAGYVYSGRIAAAAYAPLAPRRHLIRRVVMLGPTHRVAIRGMAFPTADAFATPLG